MARCIARARDGDGGVGESAGGPMRGTSHPQERSPQGRAGPSATIPTGPLRMFGPVMWGSPTVMIDRQAVMMIIMGFEEDFAMVWFVRNMCASF